MTDSLRPPRGFYDLMPDAMSAQNKVLDAAKKFAYLSGYGHAQTPVLEHVGVFDRSLGQSSDIITKEIYHFTDNSGNVLAMRPEFTAGIVRAVISAGEIQNLPLKLFTHGPVFRYDRPQRGRQREFNQINFEHIGTQGALADAEILSVATQILKHLGLQQKVRLEINSLGCFESRKKYNNLLVHYFTKYESDLSDESKGRLKANPLRILDSKSEQDIKIAARAPKITSSLTKDADQYFDQLQSYLQDMRVDYAINPYLVRGLDYYCHTIFEFTSSSSSRQNTLIAGGRYDGLARTLGAKNPLPGVGFAGGIERMILEMEDKVNKPQNIKNVILPIDALDQAYAAKLAYKLRSRSIAVDMDYQIERNFSKRVTKWVKAGASFLIFCGEQERKENACRVKDLANHTESLMDFDRLAAFLRPKEDG